MRKVLLSIVVIVSFIGYVWYVHAKGSTQHLIIASNKIGKSKTMVTPTDIPVTPTPTSVSQTQQPTSIQQPTATSQPPTPTAVPQQQGQYKDGTYSGAVADAFYGPLQVQVTVTGGKISNVQFLQAPNDRSESIQINQQADPMLAQEAIQAQSANVDIVSGATQTSQAFVESMQSALSQAKS